MDVAARKHVGEFVADQFAGAELALRAACGLIAMLMTCHLCKPNFYSSCPALCRASTS
jgi:hypothetical protein